MKKNTIIGSLVEKKKTRAAILSLLREPRFGYILPDTFVYIVCCLPVSVASVQFGTLYVTSDYIV